MNPHAKASASPATLWLSVRKHRELIWQLARRDVQGRYRGSHLGLVWPLVHPLLMLLVYTFVFSVVFQTRWSENIASAETSSGFAVPLFVGMIVHGLLAEVLNRAPTLIVANPNYVKRVIFPLEVLPIVTLLAALFHTLMGVSMVLLGQLWLQGSLHWTALLFPLVMLPFSLLVLGLAWILASLGVYLRDISQVTGLATTVMMFLAPVFYPTSALPASMRPWLLLNPVTFIIEQSRAVLVWGVQPNWAGLAGYTMLALFLMWLGFAWFQRTRKGFADVL